MRKLSRLFIVLVLVAGVTFSFAQDAALPTLQEAPCREELQAEIAKAQDTVKQFGEGHVVVGRVVLDGPEDPCDVKAQMEILQGGYFAGETKDLIRPIGFRMHQYGPLDVELKGKFGDVVDIGTVRMSRLPSAELLALTGKIILEGTDDARAAALTLSVENGPVNTPHNGTSPRHHWPSPIKAEVRADGEVSASGFSPIAYYCIVKAPGYVEGGFSVTFKPGQVCDLGTIRLERPRQIALTYVVADKPPFDLWRKKQTFVSGGDRWKATPDIYGWDLEFKQDGGKILVDHSYSPCFLQDLGEGNIEDFAEVARTISPQEPPRGQEVRSGHVYLVNQGHWERWIIFRIDIR